MIGLNPKAIRTVTIDADVEQNGDAATAFLARGWSVADDTEIRAAFARANDAGTEIERGEARYAAIVTVLRRSLTGWKRFPDANGAEIVFASDEAGNASPESIAAIPLWARAELATKIMTLNGISSETVGKPVPSPEGAGAK